MLANIMIAAGVIGGALGVGEEMLSRSQKESIQTAIVWLWDKLHEAKRRVIVDWLLREDYRVWFVFLGLVVLAVNLGAYLSHWGIGPGSLPALVAVWAVLLLLSAVAGLFGRFALLIILRGSKRWAVIRSTGLLIGLTAAAFTMQFVLNQLELGRLSSNYREEVVMPLLSLPQLLAGFAWIFIQVSLIIMIQFVQLALIPILIVLLVQVVFSALEFVVRRIAESPKGAVLSLSGFATALGGCLKLFA